MSNTAIAQTGTTQTGSIQPAPTNDQTLMIRADYVFIAILFFALGIWVGSSLVRSGAKASRLLEGVGSKIF